MKKNNELIDGIEISTWKEIEMIAKTYPKPIRYSDGLNSKIALLKFYLEPLLPDGKPPIESMDKGRMLTIAYRLYKSTDGDAVTNLSLKIINQIIN
jgi:hypothetical protein